jgi:hypothetical protein
MRWWAVQFWRYHNDPALQVIFYPARDEDVMILLALREFARYGALWAVQVDDYRKGYEALEIGAKWGIMDGRLVAFSGSLASVQLSLWGS